MRLHRSPRLGLAARVITTVGLFFQSLVRTLSCVDASRGIEIEESCSILWRPGALRSEPENPRAELGPCWSAASFLFAVLALEAPRSPPSGLRGYRGRFFFLGGEICFWHFKFVTCLPTRWGRSACVAWRRRATLLTPLAWLASVDS